MIHRISGEVWSIILAGCCLVRAASYYSRPPPPTITTSLIEGDVGYTSWALILFVAATLILAGRWFKAAEFAGHVIAFGTYLIFSISMLVAAVGFGQPWSNLAPVLVIALLHAERMFTLGATVGRH